MADRGIAVPDIEKVQCLSLIASSVKEEGTLRWGLGSCVAVTQSIAINRVNPVMGFRSPGNYDHVVGARSCVASEVEVLDTACLHY